MAIQRDPFLCCSSFADSKGDSKDCICSKFCCLKKLRSSKTYIISKSGVSIENPHRYKYRKTPHTERPDPESKLEPLLQGDCADYCTTMFHFKGLIQLVSIPVSISLPLFHTSTEKFVLTSLALRAKSGHNFHDRVVFYCQQITKA